MGRRSQNFKDPDRVWESLRKAEYNGSRNSKIADSNRLDTDQDDKITDNNKLNMEWLVEIHK